MYIYFLLDWYRYSSLEICSSYCFAALLFIFHIIALQPYIELYVMPRTFIFICLRSSVLTVHFMYKILNSLIVIELKVNLLNIFAIYI